MAEGCSFRGSKIQKVRRDEQAKTITVYAQVKVVGTCAALYEAISWIAVEPLPGDYEVVTEFSYKTYPDW
jgi:hypothetical protein